MPNRSRKTAKAAKVNAVEDAFGADVDYAQLQKIYGNDPTNETR
jgi:hypothetical protein